MSPISLKTMSLSELFEYNLGIPEYQRSYSWHGNHVEDLLKDICNCESRYLMGTVILHEREKSDEEQAESAQDSVDDRQPPVYDIVDGQQRLVTLAILLHYLDSKNSTLLKQKFSLGAAKIIQKARETIKTFLSAKSEDERKNILILLTEKNHLFFHVLVLNGPDALDRAFTFFDSVNSKGKPLSDFDLLKAHHLMFIPPKQEVLAASHNDEWLSRTEVDHMELFTKTLRRLRMWARHQDRDDKQERADYNEFSSVVDPDYKEDVEHLFNRYMQPTAFRSWRRVGDKIVLSMDYPVPDGETLIPTEITQAIEGGDVFFLYAKRYHSLYKKIFDKFDDEKHSATAFVFVRNLADSMKNTPSLGEAFRAIMLLYVDKFGEDRLVEASVCIERIISSRRWDPKRIVTLPGTHTYVKNKGLVPMLLNSVSSRYAYEQLFRIAQTADRPKKEGFPGGVRRGYFDSLRKFYENELPKITDDRARSMARFP